MCRLQICLFLLPGLLTSAALWGSPIQQDTTLEESSFRIQDYIPGDFKSRLRHVSFTLSERDDGEFEIDRNIWHDGDGKLYFREDYYHEAPQLVTSYSLSVIGQGNREKTKDTYNPEDLASWDYYKVSKGEGRSIGFGPRLYLSWEHKRYSPRLWFVGIKTYARLSCGTGNEWEDKHEIERDWDHLYSLDTEGWTLRETDYTLEAVRNSWEMSGDLDFSVGRGRVYDGTTTWWAIEILEKAADIGGIEQSSLSPADYEQLATALYETEQRLYPSSESRRLQAYERTDRIMQEWK